MVAAQTEQRFQARLVNFRAQSAVDRNAFLTARFAAHQVAVVSVRTFDLAAARDSEAFFRA